MEIIQLLLLLVICLAEPTLLAFADSRKRQSGFLCGTLKFEMRFQPEQASSRRTGSSSCLGA